MTSLSQKKWLPNKLQYQLLRAALLNGDEMSSALQQWSETVDVDLIDAASYGIIPKLYRNLAKHGIDDPELNRFKGIYRRTWTKNQFRFKELTQLLKHFYELDIQDLLLLKGAAMTIFHYHDFGIRQMGDIDILVRKRDVTKALQLLTEQGWKTRTVPLSSITPGFIETRHAVALENKNTEIEYLDLHWHLMPKSCGTDFDDQLFLDTVSTELHGVKLFGLNPENSLLHVCAHGAKASPVPLIRWIMDADAIIQTSRDQLDWQALIDAATVRHLVLPIRTALKYLNDHFGASIPKQVLDTLESIPVSIRDRREFYLRTAKHTNYIVASFASIWYKHSSLMQDTNLIFRVLRFPFYLKKYWGLKSTFSLPIYVGYKFAKTLRSMWQS